MPLRFSPPEGVSESALATHRDHAHQCLRTRALALLNSGLSRLGEPFLRFARAAGDSGHVWVWPDIQAR